MKDCEWCQRCGRLWPSWEEILHHPETACEDAWGLNVMTAEDPVLNSIRTGSLTHYCASSSCVHFLNDSDNPGFRFSLEQGRLVKYCHNDIYMLKMFCAVMLTPLSYSQSVELAAQPQLALSAQLVSTGIRTQVPDCHG